MHKETYHNFNLIFEGLKTNPRSGKIKKTKGVYTIEGVYVGASFHVRKRIKQHILDALSSNQTRFINELHPFLREKALKMDFDLRIFILSYDLTEEEMFSKSFLCKVHPKARWHNNLKRKINK